MNILTKLTIAHPFIDLPHKLSLRRGRYKHHWRGQRNKLLVPIRV